MIAHPLASDFVLLRPVSVIIVLSPCSLTMSDILYTTFMILAVLNVLLTVRQFSRLFP